MALAEDLEKLVQYVLSLHPFVQQHKGRPVLLLDDVHLFGEAFIQSWFSGSILSGDGLGQDLPSRIPVVMTLSLDGTGGAAARQVIDPLRTAGHAPSWINLLPLGDFMHARDKDLLAYEQVWLHPFNNTWFTEDLKRPWTLTPTSVDKGRLWIKLLRKYVGFPQRLIQEDFSLMTQQGVEEAYMQTADDREVLKNYLK